MKVLALCHDHPSFTPGGTEHQSHALVRHLCDQPDVDATFLAATTALSRPDVPPGTLESLGPDLLLRTGHYDAFTMARHDGPQWRAALARVIADLKPDIVHLHGLDRIGADVVTFLRRHHPRLKLVLTLHDYQIICPRDGLLLMAQDDTVCSGATPIKCQGCFPEISAARHALRAAHLRTILGQIDAFVVPSIFVRDRFIDWGLPESRIHLIRNAVPQPQSGAAPAPRAGRPNRFAYLGNLGAHKGISALLRAAQLIKDAGDDIRITIHGDLLHPSPAVKAALEGQIAEAWPVAQHLGRYTPDEVPALLRNVDWVVLPAVWPENAPLGVLEAFAAERPVICTPLGGLPELVQHGVNGLHVPRGDAFALAETLRRAARDPDLWARLRDGTQRRDGYAAHLDAHLALFNTLLSKVPA